MKTVFRLFMSLMAMLMLTASCEKVVLDDLVPDGQQGPANSKLNIRTKASPNNVAGEGDVPTISYPVSIYVFDTDGTCISVSSIESESSPVSLALVEGTYSVCAIAGADNVTYSMPTKEEATPASVIALNEGKAHADLMTSQNVVTLVEGGENTLTISLERKVMLIEEVKINNVPSTVRDVSVTLSPLYKNICIGGTYEEGVSSSTVQLAGEGSSKTWINATPAYMLEASQQSATISVNFTDAENKVKTYSYTIKDELQANYKIKINGTYTEKLGVTLTGTIEGVSWQGEKTISFEFDESGSAAGSTEGGGSEGGGSESGGNESEGTESGGNTGDVTSEAPAVGTLYRGCYVLSSVQDGSKTVVTLVSPHTEKSLSYTAADQSSVKSAVDAALQDMKIEGVNDWRLPTVEEMQSLSAVYVNVNIKLNEGQLDKTQFDLFETNGIFFANKSGTITGYLISGGERDIMDGMYLRGFTTMEF